MCRSSLVQDVSFTPAIIDSDPVRLVVSYAAQITAEDQRSNAICRRIDLCDEGVEPPARSSLKRIYVGKVGGAGKAGDVGVAAGIYHDAAATISSATAKIG